jgi:hypothetical protein
LHCPYNSTLAWIAAGYELTRAVVCLLLLLLLQLWDEAIWINQAFFSTVHHW